MMLAYISGRYDTAVVKNDDTWHTVAYGSETLANEVSSDVAVAMVGQIGDAQTFTVDSLVTARERLEELVDQTEALDLFLMILSVEYSSETRRSAVQELEELLQYDEIRVYLQNIFAASPLPLQADVENAWSIVDPDGLTEKLLRSIVDRQPVITKVRNAWHAIDPSEMALGLSKQEVQRVMAGEGVFRVLVEDVSVQSRTLTNFKFAVLQNDKLKILFTNPTSFVNELASTLGQVPVTSTNFALDSEQQTHEKIDVRPRHQHATAAREAAISQVERISELFCAEQTEQAKRILEELIAEQLRHHDGESHLVKSLCNIAQAVSKRGLSDISLNILNKALEFRKGIDAQLLQQLGHELRQIREYDKALDCFQQSQKLERDHDRLWRLKADCVKILSDKGKYDEAKSEFRDMLAMRWDMDILFDLGTVHRKSGELREARESFRVCLSTSPDMYPAKAGLAEIAKQSGNPHKAIGRYNAILRELGETDTGARRIYELSLSALFRRTSQFSKSEALLQKLLNSSPGDSHANYQFAKLLLLQGQEQDAKKYFAKADQSSSVDVNGLLLSTMLGTVDQKESKPSSSDGRIIMPEDRGAMACLDALHALKTEDFGNVAKIVQASDYVDRAFIDFATVLRFHAERRLLQADYRSNYRLCRIVKRGDRGLKNAIRELACDRFENAAALEKEFFLRAA